MFCLVFPPSYAQRVAFPLPERPQQSKGEILPSLKRGSQEDALESYRFPKLAHFLGVGAQQNYLGYVFAFLKPINPREFPLTVNTTECASFSFRNLSFEGQSPWQQQSWQWKSF